MVHSETLGRSREWVIESRAGAGKGLQRGRGDGRCEVSVTRSQQTGPGMGLENQPSSPMLSTLQINN